MQPPLAWVVVAVVVPLSGSRASRRRSQATRITASDLRHLYETLVRQIDGAAAPISRCQHHDLRAPIALPIAPPRQATSSPENRASR